MNKELDFEVADLGVASVETKGGPGIVNEPQALHKSTGISDID